MKELMKSVTLNGINYHLMGNCYVPTAPNLVMDQDVGSYGMAHMKYLQMAHPDDFAKLMVSGVLTDYLAQINTLVRIYIEDRVKRCPVPGVYDPEFEELYHTYNCVTHNATCKAENEYILTGLNRKIYTGLVKRKDEAMRKEMIARIDERRAREKARRRKYMELMATKQNAEKERE